jgi:nephrocystin-3
MHTERELLVKRVFPELRRLCSERFVTFTEVDLRWGITEEQTAEGKVLPICLDEIERSRPYFIGLLGERYGWIADAVPAEVIDREPWLKEHLGERTSVTELEILHGVLRRSEMHGHAHFYFRDPQFVDRLPPDATRSDFESEDSNAREKLRRLKDRIRLASESGACRLLENYRDPQTLADAVHVDFAQLIEQLYPSSAVPDPLDQESGRHASYAASKRFMYVERPRHSNALSASVAGSGPPLVVTGESGGGKTALLAAWSAQWGDEHPDDLIIQHYFGATPESASVAGFLQRLMGELKRRYGIDDDIPAQPDTLRVALPQWLARTINGGRVVLVLDGLNQVEGDEPDRRLGFLPRQFPPHMRVLASALPGTALDELRMRGWAEYELPPPDTGERNQIVSAFLRTHRKTLREDLRVKLIAAPGAANPLFLRTVLEELRQFGSFELLAARLDHYLEAGTPDELFRLVLRRWKADFDAEQQLVRRSLSLLWAARQGLAEAEWLELLASPGDPLARQHWRPLFLAMDAHLAQRAGLYAFGHDFLRRAVELEFLTERAERDAAHLKVADYFEQQRGMTARKAAEWPWQLGEAEEWQRLEAALTTRLLFHALFNDRTKWELTRLWLVLQRGRPGSEPADAYSNALESWRREYPDPHGTGYDAHQLARFLAENGAYEAAEKLYRMALEVQEISLGAEHPRTVTTVHNQAALLLAIGDYRQAEALFRRVLEVRERRFGGEHADTLITLNNLAALLIAASKYEQAEPLFRRALETLQRVLGSEHPNTLMCSHNLGNLLECTGDDLGAELLYRQALEAQRRVLGLEHPDTLVSLNSLARVLGSEVLFNEALEAQERVIGADHPNTLNSKRQLAYLLAAKGEVARAEPMYQAALEGLKRVLGPRHPDTLDTAEELSYVLSRVGENIESAEQLHRRTLAARERALEPRHSEVAISLNNLAVLLRRMGRAAEAEPLLRRAVEIERQVLPPESPKNPHRLNSLCMVLVMQGKLVEAKALAEEAWTLQASRHDLTSGRILAVRLAIALIEAEPVGVYVGQLKTLLAGESVKAAGNIASTWDAHSFLASARPKLSKPDADFLEDVSATLNDRVSQIDLARHLGWTEYDALPLEAAWPTTR